MAARGATERLFGDRKTKVKFTAILLVMIRDAAVR
jgi:hypothetical protein